MVLVKPFGTFEGREVTQYTLVSSSGVEVDILNWGGVVRDWRVPVRGGVRHVVLGFDSFEPYPKHSPYFGALVGRVANRVKDANFELDGESYRLDNNDHGATLHGGIGGLGRILWDAQPDDATNSVVFTTISPDGAMGFPGTVTIHATYRLDGNCLRLEFGASADRRTPVSLVQHQYFNLGTTDTILDHKVQIATGASTEVDSKLILTGNILATKPGSRLDLRSPRTLRDKAGHGIDYDDNVVLDTGRNLRDPVAVVTAPDGELTLKLWTDQPAVQFYDGVMTDVAVPGLHGWAYKKYSGLCLEDQAFPDALHNPHFPSIIIGPDAPYAHWCDIEIA